MAFSVKKIINLEKKYLSSTNFTKLQKKEPTVKVQEPTDNVQEPTDNVQEQDVKTQVQDVKTQELITRHITKRVIYKSKLKL